MTAPSFTLRPYQERVVEAALAQVGRRPTSAPAVRRTMVIVPTGGGKTVIMGALGDELGGRGLVLAHRDELVTQNRTKFQAYNKTWPTSAYTAAEKRFAPLRLEVAPGSATFASVPTLANHVDKMPAFDWVLVDECHHSVAPTWSKIIHRCLELNPECVVIGLTATPARADGKPLGDIFESVADTVEIGELIACGALVPPVAHVAEVGLSSMSTPGAALAASRPILLSEQLQSVSKKGWDFDMDEVARLVDQEPVTQAVLDRWQEIAGDRKTVFFCPSVDHSKHIAQALTRRGVQAGVVTGEDDLSERRGVIADFAKGRLQCVANAMVLTEGFDDQTVDCVVLLRPSSFSSLVIQMVGRGLRSVDPRLHPGVIKEDCIVLDFGASIRNLGGLDQVFDLAGPAKTPKEKGPPPMKPCPGCRKAIPAQAKECVLCGYAYPPPPPPPPMLITPEVKLVPYEMTLKQSRFVWVDLPDRDGQVRGRSKIAMGGRCWSIVFSDLERTWHAFGAPEDSPRASRWLVSGTLDEALAHGDAFLSREGDPKKYGRGSFYLRKESSPEQRALAKKLGVLAPEATMYRLACLITAATQRKAIARAFADIKGEANEEAA